MLDALMVVIGFVSSPTETTNRTAIYSTTPYESFEVCQGHLKERGDEIAKFLMRSKDATFTFSEGESVLVITTPWTAGSNTVTLMCKEL